MESRPLRKLFSVRPVKGPGAPGHSRPARGNGMDAAIYECPMEWARFLPPGARQVQRPGELAEHIWPLLALTPEGCQALAEHPAGEIICRLLLAPGDLPALSAQVRAETVVSYGLSPRDSLTLSSREGDTLWAALQRELVTVDGQVVERQEFPLRLEPGAGELPSLAAAGALLLLGVPPEELGRPGG